MLIAEAKEELARKQADINFKFNALKYKRASPEEI